MILMQPQAQRYGEYLEFARANRLGFELMDFAFPAVLCNDDLIRPLYDKFKGAPLHALHGPFVDLNYSGGDSEIFAVSKRRIMQCASHAKALNAPRMVVHSCFFPTLTKNDPLYSLWSEDAGELLRSVAEEFNITIYIENVLDLTPDIILMMVKAANHSRVRVCLDIGHANLSRTDLSVWMEALHPYIAHVHLSDNNGFYDDHIALGTGNVDCRLFDALAKKYSIEADYTLEVKPFEAVCQSYEYVKNNMPYVFGEGAK